MEGKTIEMFLRNIIEDKAVKFNLKGSIMLSDMGKPGKKEEKEEKEDDLSKTEEETKEQEQKA